MKKFLRMVVVFALAAGASLAYTSCTKDYDNEIKDLNTEISALQSTVSGLQTAISNLEALASTVSSQGGDISGIKATISQLQSAVDAIKSNYVTEDEAKAIAKNAVQSLKEQVEAMQAEMVTQEDLYDILSELSGGVLELMAALEMQVVGSVQSIVKLPAWYWGGVNDMDADRIQAYNMTDGLGNEVVPMSAVINAAFNVYPPTAAEKLAEDALVALRFMIPAFDVDTYVLGEIYDYTDDGDIYVKIDMTEIYDLISSTPALAIVLGNNICYGSVILLDDLTIPAEDEDDEDTVLPLTSIASTFFNIDVPGAATDIFGTLTLFNEDDYAAPVWGGALNDIEVPYNQYANSTHTFGEGLEILIMGQYTIEEFAELYNIDPALLTPEIEIIKQAPFTTQGARATKAPKFAYDEDSAEIKMDVTKLADAKAQIDNHADVNINLKVGGNVSNAFTQQYLVVEAEGGNVVIEGETFTWKGGATTYALTDEEALVEPADIKVPAAGFNFAVGAGNPGLNVPVNVQYLANEHVNLAKVTYPAGAFTYGAKAAKRKLTYEHIDADFVKTIYTMTVTVGPKPANKTLDLGTYYANGSASNAVPVDLSGIMQKMIDSDAALWAQVPVTAANPLLNQFAAGVWAPVSVIDETTNVAQPVGSFVTAFAYNAGTKKDATTLTIAAPLGFYGQKYAVSGTYTIMGVTYTVTYHVVIREASYTMVSTPYVQEGNIVPVEGAIVGGLYKLDDIHMSKYFQIDNNGEAINDVLTIDFTFDYEWDSKSPAGRYAPLGAIALDGSETATATGVAIAGIAVNAANGQLVDAANATVQWNTYGGRKIYGTAQLMAAGNPLGEPIEFTLQTANPIKSLEGRPTVLKRYSGVDVDYFAPKDSLNIITVLTDKNVAPTPKVLHAAKYPEYAITVGAFVDGEGYKPWATTVYPTLQGKLNGVDFTFTDNVHYKILADGRVQFLKDNAYGDIEVNIPLCIIHVLDYDHGMYTDPDADGFGVYSFTEGVEIINFPVVIKQQ